MREKLVLIVGLVVSLETKIEREKKETTYRIASWAPIQGEDEGFFDRVYEELGQLSCNNFTSCNIEYTHVITNETKKDDWSQAQENDENESGYFILTGRFPPIAPESCVPKIIELHDKYLCGNEDCSDGLCPGVQKLEDDTRPVVELNWQRTRLADVKLEPSEKTFEPWYEGEYFHIYKSSHVLVNNVNYLIGGEKYYSLHDKTSYHDKEFNTGVWKVTQTGLTKTSIENKDDKGNNIRISRAASAVIQSNDRNLAYICGSIFHPKACFIFDGVSIHLDTEELSIGHTDEASLIYTETFGLFLIGGGENPYYLNNKGDHNPLPNGRHGKVEYKVSREDKWTEDLCLKYPHTMVGGAFVELGLKIWSFGGFYWEEITSTRPQDSVYVLLESSATSCGFEWKLQGRLLSARSGHKVIMNPNDHTIMLVGGSLYSMNKPVEMWLFTNNWSWSNSSITKLDSAAITDNNSNRLNSYYSTVVIEKKLLLNDETFHGQNSSEVSQESTANKIGNNHDCIKDVLHNNGLTAAGSSKIIEECIEISSNIREALSCVMCKLEDDDFRDFVFDFCEPTRGVEMCSLQEKRYNNLVRKSHTDGTLYNVSWTTVVVDDGVDEDFTDIETVARQFKSNFENADDIIPPEARVLPDETVSEISDIIGDVEDIIDKIDTNKPPNPTEESFGIDSILLISIGTLFGVMFLLLTVVASWRENYQLSILSASLSLVLAFLTTTGYFWLTSEIDQSTALGLIISTICLSFIFMTAFYCSTVKVKKTNWHSKSSTVYATSITSNPYELK